MTPSSENQSSKVNEETHQTTDQVEQVCDIIGDSGLWQLNITIFCITASIFTSLNGLVANFYQAPSDFECTQDNFVNYWKENVSSSINQCELPNGIRCSSWRYFNGSMDRTAVSDFNWVCGNSWLASFSVTMYMIGVLATGVVSGLASDLVGRKNTVVVAFCIEITGVLLSAFAPNQLCFIISRGLTGFGCYGRQITSFLIAIESYGTKYRALVGIAINSGWAAGSTLTPILAYFAHDYRNIFLMTAIPQLVWLIWAIFFIPESPRWLLTKKKYKQAHSIITNAARMNGLDVNSIDGKFEQLKLHIEKERLSDGDKSGFIDLIKSKTLLKYTLVFYLLWFTNAFVYYGISLNVSDLGSNLFWSTFWSGLIEFPAYFVTMILMRLLGRRSSIILIMTLSGISCLAVIPFYTFVPMNRTIVQIFALAGKFCATGAFGFIYVYSSEVYPTKFRQISLGTCSTFARFGSIISPFMKELTAYTNYGTTMAFYSFFALLSALLAVTLPETKGKEIPDTVTDCEKLSKKPTDA